MRFAAFLSLALSTLVATANASLVVHYTLDDNGSGGVSNVNTGSSGHTFNSSAGATLNASGKFGQAGNFVTTSQWWSNAATGADMSLFTLSMHLKVSAVDSLNWQDYASIGTGNDAVFVFEHNGAHNGASIYTSGTVPGTGGSAVTIPGASGPDVDDGGWHHLAMVSNGTTVELFVDGTSQGSDAYTGTGAVDAFQLAARFGGGRGQNGTIDDVAIYNTALTSTQITWLGSNVANATASAVPEPTSLTLFGIAGLGMCVRRRKK